MDSQVEERGMATTTGMVHLKMPRYLQVGGANARSKDSGPDPSVPDFNKE